MIYSCIPKEGLPEPTTLILTGSPDELAETPSGYSRDVVFTDEVAGYTVIETKPGQHDGQPATTVMLADSMGTREVGRLVIRNDACREEVLTWERYFEEPADATDFHYQFETGGMAPAGFERVKARKLDVGDRVYDSGQINELLEVYIQDGRVAVAWEGYSTSYEPDEEVVASPK